MEESVAGVIDADVECGVVLSPRFPGSVEPGFWSWLVEGLDAFYFDIYLFYVRGPEMINGNCDQFFQSMNFDSLFW